MVVQMNTRIDAKTKRDGDEVFARAGYSASQVVRMVWEYAARNASDAAAVNALLESLKEPTADQDAQREMRMQAVRSSGALVDGLLEERGLSWTGPYKPLPYAELRERALIERASEKGLL